MGGRRPRSAGQPNRTGGADYRSYPNASPQSGEFAAREEVIAGGSVRVLFAQRIDVEPGGPCASWPVGMSGYGSAPTPPPSMGTRLLGSAGVGTFAQASVGEAGSAGGGASCSVVMPLSFLGPR